MTAEKEHRYRSLMIASQEGDTLAYNTLLREVAIHLRVTLRRKFNAAEQVEDLVQDVLIALHHSRHTYDPARSFLSWLHSIAHYRFVDHYRKLIRVGAREVYAPFDWDNAEAAAHQDDFGFEDLLDNALKSLPVKQRRIIEMLKIEDNSVKEVARELQLSESNVKVMAHRAYARLRELLGGPHE